MYEVKIKSFFCSESCKRPIMYLENVELYKQSARTRIEVPVYHMYWLTCVRNIQSAANEKFSLSIHSEYQKIRGNEKGDIYARKNSLSALLYGVHAKVMLGQFANY